MDLNLKYILIGAVIIILMVAFGNNPVENAREEAAALKKGKDPLMESIREYNEKNGKGGGSSDAMSSSGRGYTGSGSGNSAYNSDANSPPPMPSYMYRGGQQPAPSTPTAPVQNTPRTPANSYYPPSPSENPAQR